MRVPKIITEYRFSYLLASLLFVLVLEPAAFGLAITSWVFDLFYSATLILAVFALTNRRRFRTFVVLFGAFTLIATWLVHALPDKWYPVTQALSHGLGFCFMIFVTYSTVHAVLTSAKISLESVFGCIAGYLLLGTAWGTLYSALQLFSPDCFDMGTSISHVLQQSHARLPVFIYYSFVTLTTVGFGDITPVTQMARTLSWVEAVVGQFYIATLVAGTVSVLTSNTIGKRDAELAAELKSVVKKR